MRTPTRTGPWPLLVLLCVLAGCASARPSTRASAAASDGDRGPSATSAFQRDLAPLPDAPEEDEGRSLVAGLLLYLPNRIIDAFDVVRAGVDVGPGVGGSAQVTSAARLAYLSRLSVGVGLQSLRHLPVKASSDVELGVGPVGADVGPGIGWYRSPTDVRVEVHPFVAGAHVAFDPAELIDLVVGLFGFDPSDDDL